MKASNTSTPFREEVDFTMQIEPRHNPMEWADFHNNYPPCSVAIDGYVKGGVHKDLAKPIASYDHHLDPEEQDKKMVDRSSMRATMGQIMMAVRGGFYSVFRNEYGPKVNAFFKGCDEDDCFSKLLLAEPQLIFSDVRGRLERLVGLAEKMDTTAGTYQTYPDSKLYEALVWVTDPYREFRQSGQLDHHIAKEYADIMDQVGTRIKRFINGTHRHLKPDTSYLELGGGPGWIMIEETGKQGRMGAINDGYQAIVSVRRLPNGKYAYVFTRLSDYITYFDLPFFIRTLNTFELMNGNSTHQWGGSGDLVMGSPWGVGTDLDPVAMEALINKMMTHAVPASLIENLPRNGNDNGNDHHHKRLQICH